MFCTTMPERAAWQYLLVPWRADRVLRHFASVLRGIHRLRSWSMVEVLMLGVLITIVKLRSLAHVLAGPSIGPASRQSVASACVPG